MAQGFQTFQINDEFGDGSCSDIIGHEFTHCVTNTAMITNIYENDYGAINEGMSDVMGNLIEMYFNDSPGGEWLLGERHSNGVIRSLKDPHEHGQPEYVWDQYYLPNAPRPDRDNDYGGVHTNSSLLNILSYKLYQAGMGVEDQLYFWMNAALSMTPSTDYPQLAQILPWCLKITGYSQYADAFENAIEETDLARISVPEKDKNGNAIIKMELPFKPDEKNISLSFNADPDGDEDSYRSWPDSSGNINVVLPEGDYQVYIIARKNDSDNSDDFIQVDLTGEGWENSSSANGIWSIFDSHDYKLHVNKGEVISLKADGLENALSVCHP